MMKTSNLDSSTSVRIMENLSKGNSLLSEGEILWG
jgi:hypothetical protein